MKQKFADALVEAQGRSEFIIVVVADIRGFSAFSTTNESPNIAMFIKRFYLQLINKYFVTANFVKPTGDGLLMTFPYSEKNLLKVSETVVTSCIACLTDFPTVCSNDPMINFQVPKSIGFGIARGTACCLYSGEEILDYSGHLLNLASRLNDLARPSGIIIDGNFIKTVIPESARESFVEQQVYIRSIAELIPVDVLYLKDYVQIPEAALSPLIVENWQTEVMNFTAKKLADLTSTFLWYLPTAAKSEEKIKLTVIKPKPGVKGISSYMDIDDFKYREDGPKAVVVFDMGKVRETIESKSLRPQTKIVFKLDYVPKPLPRS